MVYAVVEGKNVTTPRRLGSNLGDLYRFHAAVRPICRLEFAAFSVKSMAL